MATPRKASRNERFQTTARVAAWHRSVRTRHLRQKDGDSAPPASVFHAFRMEIAEHYPPRKPAPSK
ncbi:MAG: hypothetical protein KDH17_15650 [Rhodocyclaceae bacterium]|nr:hypothetical protein [Rhodocyclaceae bacterium]